MLSKILCFLSLLLFSFSKSVSGAEEKITSESEFSAFVTKVNSGTNYSGTTVLLDSDLSLSGVTPDPIGIYNNSNYKYFLGVFDGQGHVISDIKMNSSSKYTGLFGYSNGLTIKNVVLDSSCSITSSYDGSNYIGGIIGQCYASGRHCNIENSVNMADVTFSRDGSDYIILGGIAGLLSLYSYQNYAAYVKNCANYGSVTHSGTSSYSYIGGVVGEVYASSNYKYLFNCLNYGAITHSGTTTDELQIGGIVGYGYYTYFENCVSAGKISTQNTPSKKSYIGSIVGYIEEETHISYCYYTSEMNYGIYGRAKSTPSRSNVFRYDNTTFELSGTVSIGNYTGNSLVDVLNAASDYYATRDYSKWLLNRDGKSVSFIMDSRAKSITMSYQIILLHSLATNENQMFYWYEDSGYIKPLETFDITKNTALYGKFKENTDYYTITFNSRNEGVSVAPQTAQFGAIVSLPNDLNNESHSVVYWETEYGENVGFSLTMPAHNFILRAVWMHTHIASLDDFMLFAEAVKSGSTYLGVTVFLDADLSFSDKAFNPINGFRGVFDGQGHVISNLNITSSSSSSTPYYSGLFGFSNGLTIRNVVLDDSCSIANSYSDSNSICMGGIIGDCYANSGQCNIENSVNMAGVTFSGNLINGNSAYLGGIVGYLASLNYESSVKNCANYGSVTHSGTTAGSSYIGGITGYIRTYVNGIVNNTYFHNCFNYGAITFSGSISNSLYLGGIEGYNQYTYVENCVSAGKITSTGTVSRKKYVGSIVGTCANTHLDYCYYTSNVGVSNLYGSGTPESTTGTSTSSSSISSSLVDKLNSHASGKGWNKWLLNTNGKSVTFKMNDNEGFILSYSLMVLPNLASDSRSFVGWFTDDLYNEPFSDYSISDDTTLYGRWDMYAVTLNPNGGSVPKTTKYVTYESEYGELPKASMSGYTFLGWYTEKTGGSKVKSSTAFTSSSDIILYAHWAEGQVEVSSSDDSSGQSKGQPGNVGALYPFVQLISLLV